MTYKNLLLLFIIFFSVKLIAQEHNYPKRITTLAVIDSVYTSPCHYETLYLAFKLTDTLNAKNSTLFLSQGLRGYNHSTSYIKKIYPNNTNTSSDKNLKAEVYIGLYYHNKTSKPILEWISEKSRKESLLSLKDFLIKEGIYKIGYENFPVALKSNNENTKLFKFSCSIRNYLSPNLMYEQDGVLHYRKDEKNWVAIEIPIGSGNWSSYELE